MSVMAMSKYFFVSLLFISYSFEILAFQDVEPAIIVKDLNEGQTVLGNSATLECRSTFNLSYVSIFWFHKSGHVNADAVTEEDTSNSSYITISRLTLPDVQKYEQGHFTCRAMHKEKQVELLRTSLLFSVWDRNSHIISFGHIDRFQNAALELGIYIRAHPKLSSVTWVHNGNKTIMTNPLSGIDSRNILSNEGQYNYYLRLPFDTLTAQHFGEYSVLASNDVDNETISFFVELSNKTVINLSYDYIDENAMTATFKCEGVSFRKNAVTWIFRKYDFEVMLDNVTKKDDRNGTKLKEFRFEENGLKLTFYVSLNLSEAGFLECHVGSFSKELEVVSVQNGFDIFAKDMVKSSNGSNIVYVAYGHKATLVCVVSLFNYTDNISWYRRLFEGDFHEHYEGVYTKMYLTVNRITQNDVMKEDTFHCEAYSREGKLEIKTVKVLTKKIPSLHPQIIIKDTKKGHTLEGEILELTCEITFWTETQGEWHFYNQLDSDSGETLTAEHSVGIELDLFDSYKYIATSKYVTQGNVSKRGVYACGVLGLRERISVSVYGSNDNIIKFDNETSVFDRTKKEIRVFLEAHPKPTIQWFDNNGETIPTHLTSVEYTAKNFPNNYVTTFSFEKLSFENNGVYEIVAGIPTSRMEVHELDEENMTSVIKCSSVAYPEPKVRWYFQKCDTLESCVNANTRNENNYKEIKELRHERHGLEVVSYISLDLSEIGFLRCLGRNVLGENYTEDLFFYVKNNFDIFANETVVRQPRNVIEMVIGEQVKLMCAVSITIYKEELQWLVGDSGYFSKRSGSSYKFLFSFITVIDPAVEEEEEYNLYTCLALGKDGFLQSKTIKLEKRDKEKLVIQSSNMRNKSVEVSFGAKWKFECKVKGFPIPIIKWLKDNHTLRESENIKISNNNQELEIHQIDTPDEGEYTCQVSNRFEMLVAKEILTIRINFQWAYLAAPISVVVTLAVVAAVIHYAQIRKQSALFSELNAGDLANFEHGNLKNFNPDLGIEEQADLLPYDKKWEIPFDNVKLDKQLGSGAFGVVFKAQIIKYFPDEPTVAVKTTDPTSGFECVKNLATELKIMSHVGKHLNIINLLGACTRNIARNQKNYKTDQFDWTVQDDDSRNDHVVMDDTGNTVQYTKTAEMMYSKDLLIWAFQVSRGMEYLTSRRIVHGDLAARNILLTDNNVVKISDFGLSKKMYYGHNYVKDKKGLLPIKWMAVESIERDIFSVQSDVWSFGVVLWEFFSLGGTPYPGLGIDESFYKKLVAGYRLEAPKAATTLIYDIMLECWNLDPFLRPSSAILTEKIGCILDAATRNYFINMNDGYVLMNRRTDQEDYLAMVNSPIFENDAGCSGHNVDYVNTLAHDKMVGKD